MLLPFSRLCLAVFISCCLCFLPALASTNDSSTSQEVNEVEKSKKQKKQYHLGIPKRQAGSTKKDTMIQLRQHHHQSRQDQAEQRQQHNLGKWQARNQLRQQSKKAHRANIDNKHLKFKSKVSKARMDKRAHLAAHYKEKHQHGLQRAKLNDKVKPRRPLHKRASNALTDSQFGQRYRELKWRHQRGHHQPGIQAWSYKKQKSGPGQGIQARSFNQTKRGMGANARGELRSKYNKIHDEMREVQRHFD